MSLLYALFTTIFRFLDIEFPKNPKLRIMDRTPVLPPNIRAPKMQKRLRLMRGPEPVHNFLIHKQYGIVALGGGRLKWNHFDMIRLFLIRKLDYNKMYAVWRVDAPWQPVTKKGQGQRMGGGKGAIDHYVTPIKAGRVILEIGGKCEYLEVKNILENLAGRMPFKAMAVSQEMMDEQKAREKYEEENNLNVYTMKYLIQNNMGNCHKWMSPFDLRQLGKFTYL